MKKLFFALLTLGVISTGCKKPVVDDEEPLAAPTVKITLPKYVFDIGEKIQFVAEGKGATSYKWDFGDKKGTSTSQKPVYSYVLEGIYPVTVTAANADASATKKETKNVLIGKRYVDSIVIKSIPNVDSTGNNWDDDFTGPDMLIKIGKTANSGYEPGLEWTTAIPNVLSGGSGTYTFKLGAPFLLTVEGWKIDFFDVDASGEVQMGRVWFDAGAVQYNTRPIKIEKAQKTTTGALAGLYIIELYYTLGK